MLVIPLLAAFLLQAPQAAALRVAESSEALVGKPAPQVLLDLVDGKHFDLSRQRGRVVFLAFWATWCEPCRVEIPRLIAAEGNYKDLVVIGVSTETSAEVTEFLKDFRYFSSAIDVDGKITRAYGVDLLPRLFVIDQKGIVVKMIRGVPSEAAIKRVLESLLK